MPMTPPAWSDHPTVAAAMILARRWCPADRSAGRNACAHALDVVEVLHGHLPGVPPEVVAAVLLRDSADLAPPGTDLDATLATLVSWEVARIVRGLRHEQDAVAGNEVSVPPPASDQPLMQASAAEKIVRLRAVLDGSQTALGPGASWSQPQGFIPALSYLRAFHRAAQRTLPPPMAAELGGLVKRVELRVARMR